MNAKREETREVRQFAEPEATPVQAKLLERYWLCVVGCDVAGGGGVGAALSVRININPASKTKTIVKPSGTKKVVPRRSTLGMLSLSAIETSKRPAFPMVAGLAKQALALVIVWSPRHWVTSFS
jgi:hypothetical protein